jgi:hypothetical protein
MTKVDRQLGLTAVMCELILLLELCFTIETQLDLQWELCLVADLAACERTVNVDVSVLL